MKTKTIPFDLETAKKIKAGELKGRVMCNNAEAHIIDLGMYFQGKRYICAQVLGNLGKYITSLYDINGADTAFAAVRCGLYIELQYPNDVPQFKPFDKVLVRNKSNERWHPSLYAVTDGLLYYTTDCKNWQQCVPYEGNQELVGTTNKPE